MAEQDFEWTHAIRLVIAGLLLIILAVQGKISVEVLLAIASGALIPVGSTVAAIKEKLA